MPMYDVRCLSEICGFLRTDKYEHSSDSSTWDSCERCGGPIERVLLPGSTSNVIGDEIDITVPEVVAKNPDGTPRRFRSREEWKRVVAANGYTNLVEHKGGKGSDKSKWTKRWV